jgi:hypothetical protein
MSDLTRQVILKADYAVISVPNSASSAVQVMFRRNLEAKLCGRIQSMRRRIGIVIISIFLAVPAWADNAFTDGAKNVGNGFKRMGQETGWAFKEGGEKVGHGVREMGRETGQTVKETGISVGEWFRDTGQKTGEAFQEMGRNIRSFFTSQ